MIQGAKNLGKKFLKTKLMAILPAVAPFLLGVLAFVFMILVVAGPIAAAAEAISQGFDNLAGFFSGNTNNPKEQEFFEVLKNSNIGCEKSKIVMSTIMYYYQFSPNSEIDMGELPTEDTVNVENSSNSSEEKTEELFGKMLPDLKTLTTKINGNMDDYESYVKNTFLESNPYNKLLKDTSGIERTELKNEIYDNMISFSESIQCPNNLSSGYYAYNCPGVVVTGEYAGTYPLEEYIAGVVAAENGGAGVEGLKAQAIVARNYVLVQTNNCTTPIVNSEDAQVFTPTDNEKVINAVNETAGQVLTLNGDIISTYFASYPQVGTSFPAFPSCGSINCDDKTCTTTFYKMPTAEPFTLTTNIYNPSGNYWNGYHLQNQGGHCYGFSQVAGRDLEVNHGMDYTQLLETFHSDGVAISSSMGAGQGLLAADSTGFSKRVGWPDKSNPSDVIFWFSNNNLSYSSNRNLVGQCTWYAYGRANEILAAAGSTYRWRHAPHAGQWYKYNLNDGTGGFKSSMDINSPKKGAIMVLSGGTGVGHVLIVEGVYDDGDIAISEANVCYNNSNPYCFRYIEKISPSAYVEQFKNKGYTFGGYIYMLE